MVGRIEGSRDKGRRAAGNNSGELVAETGSTVPKPRRKRFRDQRGLWAVQRVDREARKRDCDKYPQRRLRVEKREIDETVHATDCCADHVQALAAEAVRQVSRGWYPKGTHRGHGEHTQQYEVARDAQYRRAIREDIGIVDVGWRLFCHARERRQHQLFGLTLDDLDGWRPLATALGKDTCENWRLGNPEPDVQPHADHDDAEQERDPP